MSLKRTKNAFPERCSCVEAYINDIAAKFHSLFWEIAEIPDFACTVSIGNPTVSEALQGRKYSRNLRFRHTDTKTYRARSRRRIR